MQDYEVSFANFKDLTTLDVYEIRCQFGSFDFSNSRPELPLASPRSLTTLQLRFDPWENKISASNCPFRLDALHLFVNFETLQIERLDATVCRTLADIESFSLEKFTNSIYRTSRSVTYDIFLALLSSSCLRKLQFIEFKVDLSLQYPVSEDILGQLPKACRI